MFRGTLVKWMPDTAASGVKVRSLPLCLGEIFQSPPKLNTELTVQGWIKSVRLQKKIAFVDLVDGSSASPLSCVMPPEFARDLKTGSSVQIKGQLVESRGSQDFELKIPKEAMSDGHHNSFRVKLLGSVPADYPLQKKSHTYQFLRTLPHLRWRTQSLSTVLRARSFIEKSISDYFYENKFIKTAPPVATSSDCEGAGELFSLESESKIGTEEKFFGKKAYLSVSAQLHLEVLSAAVNRVWCLNPCFRAEESDTNRHLSEFWMLEAEMAFVEDVHDLTRFSEQMIRTIVQKIMDDAQLKNDILATKSEEGAQKLLHRWKAILSTEEWPNVTYTEAIEILQRAEDKGEVSFHYKPVWGNSLQSEHEKWLAGVYFQRPVAVTDYPTSMKPFYMKINDDGKTAACYDLLVPELGELIGGSLREHDAGKLDQNMQEKGMKSADIEWYLALRENGTVPHGGFGMGFERLICYLTDVENIRDVIPFPRHANNCMC